MNLARSLFMMSLLMGTLSSAQSVCPTDPFPRCRGPECKCRPAVVGDPINMMAAQTMHVVRDVSVDVGPGSFELWRYYSSSPGAATRTGGDFPSGPLGPFGMLLAGTPPAPSNPQWSHDLFSFVDGTNATYVFVFEGNMTWSQFLWNPSTYGFLARAPGSAGHKERLEHINTTPKSFRFIRDDGQQWIYGGTSNSISGTFYYLSEVRSRTGQAMYAVQYSSGGQSCGGGHPAGPPYIERVTFPSGGLLDFAYTTSNGQCALATISWRANNLAGPTVVAGFTYGGATVAKIASGGPTGREETYVHASGSLEIKAPGGRKKVVHNYDTGGLANYLSGEGNERNISIAAPIPAGVPSSGDLCSAPLLPLEYGQRTATFSGMAEAAGGSPNALKSTFYSYADTTFGGDHTSAFKERKDECITPSWGFCSAGTVVESRRGRDPAMACNSGNPVASVFQKNKRDYWSGNVKKWEATQGDFYPSSTTRGASTVQPDPLLGDRLEYTRFNYPAPSYTNGIRLSDSRQAPSSLNPGGSPNYSNERDEFDGTGFKLRSLFSGWTKDFSGSLTYRTRGTFYSTSRICTSPATDTLGRTLRIEGPCWTTNNTNCADSTYPMTEFVYYAASAADTSGRLWKVLRYPGFAPGAPPTCSAALTPVLTTEYLSYTPEGLPLQVKDEAGVTTTYTYVSGRIATRTVAGLTTTYTYEADGAVRSIQHPEGNYEVFCRYGTTTDVSCSFAVPADQKPRVVWKAKSASSNGAAWSERVEYEYWPDGSLRYERSKDSTGVVRSKRAVYRDAHGRVTYETSGNDAPGTTTVGLNRSFDGADNMDAIGPSFTGAPTFCRVGGVQTGAVSPLCAWMTYDGANRLARVDLNPTGAVSSSDSIRSCFDYDLQGRLKKFSPGCATTSGCSFSLNGYNVTSCTEAPGVDYETDDFGNVVRVNTPWSSVSGYGTTYYDFDARGNLLAKQTEQLRFDGAKQVFTYDGLNRLTAAHGGTAGLYHLFSLGYDVPLSEPGCPALTNVGGRLAFRYDSFGYTWYGYTPQGWVNYELRQRLGTSGTCAMNLANNPSTQYVYTANGNLSQLLYPYGRKVTYTYGTGANTDRVDTVWVTHWPGWGSAKPTSRRLAINIAWEPYGGLRGYRYLTGASNSDETSVEYFRSDVNESVNTSNLCGVTSLSATAPDGTGRTRALWLTSPAAALGGGSGNVLKQFYTWSGDQLVGQQTCFSTLGQTNEHYQSFGYDKTARLTTAGGTGMPVRTSGTNPNVYTRSYSYDRRGNRLGWSVDNCQRYNLMGNTYGTPNQLDFLTQTAPNNSDPGCNGQWGANAYYYDRDGNTTRIGGGWAWWSADMSYPTIYSGNPVGGLDSVFKSVLITGAGGGLSGNYQYFYDAFNRRRAKFFPFDAKEEYFYDLGHQMLSNVGGNLLGPATQWTVDDYVWLDGRPIAMVRGNFSSAWVRNSDAQASCNRLGEGGKCGVHHLVSDYLPKPVMMVESTTNLVTNAALYDEFGHVNRVPLITGMVGYGSGTVGTASNPQGGNVDARVRFNYVDIPSYTNVTLTGSGGGVAWSQTFADKARVWTNWVYQGTDPTVTVGLSNWPLWDGVMTEFMEYRRYTSGATPTWTPIRFPGQFHDPETDLFENWNRYYEPWTGRYVQPEPMLAMPQSNPAAIKALHPMAATNPNEGPIDLDDKAAVTRARASAPRTNQPHEFVLENAKVRTTQALAQAVYSYAQSNPQALVDPAGLQSSGGKGKIKIDWVNRAYFHPGCLPGCIDRWEERTATCRPAERCYLMYWALEWGFAPEDTPGEPFVNERCTCGIYCRFGFNPLQ